jgi:hypothetical protein
MDLSSGLARPLTGRPTIPTLALAGLVRNFYERTLSVTCRLNACAWPTNTIMLRTFSTLLVRPVADNKNP